jgi:hypothetical protein
MNLHFGRKVFGTNFYPCYLGSSLARV